jgi:glyoxylase-like metal-dependent hydrolase (beta-lactamase superfamily II)
VKVVATPAWFAATNSYLVYDSQDRVGVLIDIPPEPELVGQVVLDHKVTVGAVLLTHGHVDHAGGAGEFASRYGSEVYVHPDDDFLTLNPKEQLRQIFGTEPPGSYEVPDKLTDLEHGQVLDLAGFRFETRHTPGHTPGHCCFYVADEGTLFSGDQLFAGSVGRTDLPGGSHTQLLESMAASVLTLDDGVRVLPGHGPETSIGHERKTNPFIQGL